MEKDNAQHTEFLELIAMLKRLLHALKTQPVPHEKQNTFNRGYNDGYESCIENVEYFYIHNLEATQ